MQTTVKKPSESKLKREKIPKEDATKTVLKDEKLKKTPATISTPRNFIQKTTAADIYGQKKRIAVQNAKAPKKSPSTSYLTSNVSPMKDILKSSPSSISQMSTRSDRPKMGSQKSSESKTARYSTTPKSNNNFNVTINSPIVKRKLNMDIEREKSFIKDVSKDKKDKDRDKVKESTKVRKEREKSFVKEAPRQSDSFTGSSERQRTKTRTLDENEVKILTSDVVDNNTQMHNLSKKLNAKPKAFYIDLDDPKPSQSQKISPSKIPSDDDVSYEDDFESYESDFDSYHSSSPSEQNDSGETDEGGNDDDNESERQETSKDVKDEENMLDSGNFDLRDQRSANKSKPAALEFILETAEGVDKPSSLTDEGFQEMSSSSAVSSIRTVHVEVLDRPLFIDFTKSKENRRKKRIGDRLRQRANDLLSIITLHEMSYSLFEMKPISYDLYMATFGRFNYTQIAVQTFDDGITEEVQTDEVEFEHKWTQHPVEFTKNDICIQQKVESRKYSRNTEDYLTKFTFLTTQSLDVEKNDMIDLDDNYKTDPLRIYFEQKGGVGPNEMLPYETYKTKLKSNDFNATRLGKFLKKIESGISNVLNTNTGNTELSELNISKYPFSKGYVSISTKNLTPGNFSFLNNTKISLILFSETKSNFLMTVHKTSHNVTHKKCTICLWDISVATREPVKLLTAVDNVALGRLRGTTDGYFAAALDDGSIHVWDLSEEPTWWDDVASEEKHMELVETNKGALTESKKDREVKDSSCNNEPNIHCALQSSAYTTSAYNMSNGEATDRIVGLDLTGDAHSIVSQEGGRRVVGQVVSLQRIGILTIWSIVQQKSKTIPPDIGKAYWSKMKLEKNQTISLLDHIDLPLKDPQNGGSKINFNLNAAKRRMVNRKQEKNIKRKDVSRPKSAISFDFDMDEPSRAASAKMKRVLSVEKEVSRNWESGVVCCDLKVMNWKDRHNYLVAKNCGEVLCCKRILGAVRVHKFCVASDASSVTCIEVSPHRLPYFLAATDTGTISVCSLLENRVLLTLDCRNIQSQDIEKCHSDDKGRYISSVSTRTNSYGNTKRSRDLMVRFISRGGSMDMAIGWGDGRRSQYEPPNVPPRRTVTYPTVNLSVTSVSWSRVNPCCLFASLLDGSIVEWQLCYSDIYAKYAGDAAASACVAGDSTLALLTPEGDVQVHKLTNEHRTKEYLLLFEKYVALL